MTNMKLEDFCDCGHADCRLSDGQSITTEAAAEASALVSMVMSYGGSPKFGTLSIIIAARLLHAEYLRKHPDGDSFAVMVEATSVDMMPGVPYGRAGKN